MAWILIIGAFVIRAFLTKSPSHSFDEERHLIANTPSTGEPPTKDLADSGMIQVALALAALGFLLYQFGDGVMKIAMPPDYKLPSTQSLGLFLVWAGLTAAVLLHVAFIREWSDRDRAGSYKATSELRMIGIAGHLVLFVVFTLGMLWATLAAFAFIGAFAWLIALVVLVVVWRLLYKALS